MKPESKRTAVKSAVILLPVLTALDVFVSIRWTHCDVEDSGKICVYGHSTPFWTSMWQIPLTILGIVCVFAVIFLVASICAKAWESFDRFLNKKWPDK